MELLLGNKLYLRVDLSRAPKGQLYRILKLLGLLGIGFTNNINLLIYLESIEANYKKLE